MNNTNNEKIFKVTKKLEDEYSDIGITNRQVLNIAKKLDSFEFSSEKEEELALEYVARLRGSIKYYIDFMVPINQKQYYYTRYFNTIDYSIKRILSTMYPKESFDLTPIDDEELEEMISRITIDLLFILEKDNKNNKKLVLK